MQIRKVQPRKARVGFFVPTSHSGLIDATGRHFCIMGVGEKLRRELRQRFDVTEFGQLIKGRITAPQMPYDTSVPVDTRRKANRMAEMCRKDDVDAVVLFLPTFLHAHLYVQALQRIGRPVVLWGNDGMEGCQAIGLWAMRGTLDALGTIPHRDIYGSPDDAAAIQRAADYIEACRVVQQLRASVIGIFGTMSMGMLPGACEDIEWLRTFGVQSEHLECQSLRREGEKFSKADVKAEHRRLCRKVRKPMELDDWMDMSLRVHLGHKKLIKEHGLDFDGVKGTFELTDHYASPCLDLALLNEASYVSADTSEPKGALTMYILRLLADAAHFQGDIERVDRATRRAFWACNGAFNLATAPKTPDGKYDVELCRGPHLEGQGGAIWTNHVLKNGDNTIARLARVGDKYVMQISRGAIIDSDQQDRWKLGWPTAPFGTQRFADGADVEKFIGNLRSQYNHFVYADVADKLVCLCELLGIEPIVC